MTANDLGRQAYTTGAACPFKPGTPECWDWHTGHGQARIAASLEAWREMATTDPQRYEEIRQRLAR